MRSLRVAGLIVCIVGCQSRAAQPSAPSDGPLEDIAGYRIGLCEREAEATRAVDKIDLLFMVDNSNSMAEEQASLREQFPRLMQILTSGRRSPDDPRPWSPRPPGR